MADGNTLKVGKEEIELNMQINYTIIRNLWFVVKGEVNSSVDGKNLYDYVNISRTRYDRICGGGAARISQALLEKVKHDIEIDEEIFTGRKRLSLAIKNKDTVYNKMDIKLQEYAVKKKKLRLAREANNQCVDINKKKKVEDIEPETNSAVRDIHDKLKIYLRKNFIEQNGIEFLEDVNMKKLTYFIRDGDLSGNSITGKVSGMILTMDKITFGELENVKSKVLGAYVKSMKMQIEKANILLDYRKAKRFKNQ